jgi:hypothetical protein
VSAWLRSQLKAVLAGRGIAKGELVPLSEGTRDRVKALFGPDTEARVVQLLAEDCGNNLPFCEQATPTSSERIRYAVLKLSGGNLEELGRAIELAKTDWRDVLVGAGFGQDVTAHHKWFPAAKR